MSFAERGLAKKIDCPLGKSASIERFSDVWRFSPDSLETIDEDTYERLEATNANQSSLYYLYPSNLPSTGSLVYKIELNDDCHLSILFSALVMSSEFRLVNSSTELVVFKDDTYSAEVSERTLKFRRNFSLPLFLKRGVNFIILNYKQYPIARSDRNLINAGLERSVRFSSKDRIDSFMTTEDLMTMIPTGVLLCLAVYSLLIYFSRNERDSYALLLFLLNLSLLLRELCAHSAVSYLETPAWFNLGFASSIVVWPSIANFLSARIFLLRRPSRFVRVISYLQLMTIIVLVISNIIMATSSESIPLYIPGFQSLSLFGIEKYSIHQLLGAGAIVINFSVLFFVLLPVSLKVTIYDNERELLLFTVGLCCLAIGMFADLLKVGLDTSWPWLATWASLIFSFCLAKIDAQRFTKSYTESLALANSLQKSNAEIKHLNDNLEDLVEVRTNEVNSILQHVPQGIFRVNSSLLIDPSYSKQLNSFFLSTELAGKSFINLLKANAKLSESELSILQSSLQAILGDSILAFDLNEDKLPRNLVIENTERLIYTKATWNPEISREGICTSILVTFLDASREYQAEKQLELKNQSFDILKEIFETNHEEIEVFFKSWLERLSSFVESEFINIQRTLFNLHTFKGEARGLRLKLLSQAIHDCESSLLATSNRSEALEIIDKLIDLTKEYQKVDSQIYDRYIRRDNTDKNYITIDMCVRNTFEKAVVIKDDYALPPVKLDVKASDIAISSEQAMIVKSALLHIFRNSISHGFSKIQSKFSDDLRPTIFVEIISFGDQVQLVCKDNGRGIYMSFKDNEVSDPKIRLAEVKRVFEAGYTTIPELDQNAGRGIGLSSVDSNLKEIDGQISIELGIPKEEPHYFDFAIVISFPLAQKLRLKRV